MEIDSKAIIGIVVVILGLFAGGLYYIYKESQRHELAYKLMQQYINTTDNREQALIEAEVRKIIDNPPFVQTTKASLDSWDNVLSAAWNCDDQAKGLQQLDPSTTYEDNWRTCMDKTLEGK